MDYLVEQVYPTVSVRFPRITLGARPGGWRHDRQVSGRVDEIEHRYAQRCGVADRDDVPLPTIGDQVRGAGGVGGNDRQTGGQCFELHLRYTFEVTWENQNIALAEQRR